jgi:hemolysin activation/secretion protein
VTRGKASVLLTALLLSGAASAQAPPRPPTREEIERGRPPPPPAQPPRLTVEGGIERAPCALDDERFRAIRFTPRAVSFEHLRGLSADALRSAYEPFLGTEQPIAMVCEIRDRAATLLRDAGYVAAVEIPEQRIADGNIRFDVLMAKLVAVHVRGEAGRSERTIARYLERLTKRDVFNRFEAERSLLLASDLPGLDVRLRLRSAGAGPGEVVGEVSVVRTFGLVEANVQDLGARELGRWGGLVRAELYGLTGLGDRTSLALFSTAQTHEQQTLQVGHEMRLGAEGLTLSGDFTYSWARPSLPGPNLHVRARTLLATAAARYPFVRRQAASIWGGIGLDLVDQDVSVAGLPLTRDRLRIGFARLDFQAADRRSFGERAGYDGAEPLWRIGGSVELRRGLGLLGAGRACGPGFARCVGPGLVPPSRLEGDPEATLLRFEGGAEYRPLLRLAVALGVRAQVTGEPLLAFEEYAAGNYTIGRGYDPGTLLGDRGVGVQAELRYGSLLRARGRAFALQPFAFFDAAWVGNEDRLFAPGGPQHLASVGAGLRASWQDRARLEVMLAVPLNRAGLLGARPDPRLLVSLTTRLLPWRSR